MNASIRIHLLLCPIAVLGFLSLGGGSAIAAEKPNIVILLCDDLGYGDLSCFAHPEIRTPNLDKLADEGVKLTHCYSSAPVCSPSRAGLLTGRERRQIEAEVEVEIAEAIEFAEASPFPEAVELLTDVYREGALAPSGAR